VAEILLIFAGIYAYVTLKEHVTVTPGNLRLQLKELVKKEIGSFATPEIIQVFFVDFKSKDPGCRRSHETDERFLHLSR
jgi:hypothetical protein